MATSLLRHIDFCTAHNPELFLPFVIDDRTYGAIARAHATLLPSSFVVGNAAVTFAPAIADFETRSRALAESAQIFADLFGIKLTREIYRVVQKWDDDAVAEIDRAALPWFGLRGFGVHANGFVRKADGLYLWVATRARSRKIDPGKRDNLIGGGLPIGYTVRENLAKEAWEEAGIDAAIAARATAHGTINYRRDMMKGVRNDTLFLFDLELEADFTPHNTDGEVERFDLLPATEVLRIITETDSFKFNCNLVMIDFLLRHSVIDAHTPDNAALLQAFAKLKAD